jgi:hypothetical protein
MGAQLQEVQAAEYKARWEPDYQQVEAKRDELAAELASTYPKLVAQLIDLLGRVEECDREASRINGSAPVNERRRLRDVEPVARGLDLSRAHPSITRELQLPDWVNSSRLAWPPPKTPLALLVAAGSPAPFHPGANWAQFNQERAKAERAQAERVAEFYAAQERAREEREAFEWEARAQARRTG